MNRSALPNLLEILIEEALATENSAENVAATLASSDLFLRAIRKGMMQGSDDGSAPTKAQLIRVALSRAFGAPTANLMFDD